MLRDAPMDERELKQERLDSDLVVVGGGMAGTCCAITAARAGIEVVLIQDRPVLGGNASSEVRLWILGATSHMGNNNRWAREGGVIDEILVENMYRNPEGNPLFLDTILLEKVVSEPNITPAAQHGRSTATKKDAGHDPIGPGILQPELDAYEVHAPLFCDASGDGMLGFLAGAAFRIGTESRERIRRRACARKRQRGTARPLALLLYQGHRQAGPLHAAKFRPARHHADSPLPRLQRQATPAAGCGGSNGAVGSIRSTIPRRSSGNCGRSSTASGTTSRTPAKFPEAETIDAGMGRRLCRANARAGDSRATTCSRQQDIVEQRRMTTPFRLAAGRSTCIRPTACTANSRAAASGIPRASTRFPIAVCIAATSRICFLPAASSAPRTWRLAQPA